MLVIEYIVHNAMELWEEALWGGDGRGGAGAQVEHTSSERGECCSLLMKTSQFIHSILARFATVEHTAWSCDLHVMGIDCTADECRLTRAGTSMMQHTLSHTQQHACSSRSQC